MPPETALGPFAILYFVLLALLAAWGAHRVWLVARFRWQTEREPLARTEETPFVTIQLPLYNERTVAARLIQSMGRIEYPRDRFEVQVLDDSTDETRGIVDTEVAHLRARGYDIKAIRRKDRTGFKAGALELGMQRAHGEFLCVFDADFVPPADFLERMLPRFRDPKVGMVQARWDHLNRESSLLTRAQSTLLDGHFVIEHKVRHDSGLFFNFNGTAGIWRRQAIEDAGGWQHDTLTEDLDLSYRAQLAGWKFVYEPLVEAPAEVPFDISAFKSQQKRWAKGSVQVARKLGVRIWRADVPRRVKWEAAAHLLGNMGYPLVLLLAILLPLVVLEQATVSPWLHIVPFMLCTASVIWFYDTSQRAIGRRRRSRWFDVPAAMSLGIGMSLSQTRAVLEGLFGSTGEFLRTPKRGSQGFKTYGSVFHGLAGWELFLAVWFAWGLVGAWRLHLWGSMPFLLLFFVGFGWVGWLSATERWRRV